MARLVLLLPTVWILILVLIPPLGLMAILIDTALILGTVFLMLAIRFVKFSQISHRDLLILACCLLALLFIALGLWLYASQ